MNIGDKVIISPSATHDVKPGIFEIYGNHGSTYYLTNGNTYFEDELIPADPLEVGDKVTVKTDLGSMKHFPHGLVSAMRLFEGKTVTISDKCGSDDTDEIGEGIYYYFLQEDPNEYSWPLCAFNIEISALNKETIIKQSENYENRLQKHETSVTRRSTELRIGVRCRKHKARVEVSSLKHKKVVGRG